MIARVDLQQTSPRNAARQHFDTLDRDDKIQAIYRMADAGHGDYTIATAAGLSVEMVREVLAARNYT